MAKQLQIIVSAKDQATAVVRRITSDLLGVGRAGLSVVRTLTAPLRGMLSMLTSVKTLIGATLGVLAARRALSSFNAAAIQIDEMAKAAQRLQIGVEQLSSLKFTADLANVSFESLTVGIETAQKNLGQFAATGGGRAADAIRLLGLRVRDAGGGVRDFSELLPEIADAINAIPDAGRRGFLVQRLFGESGTVFLNLLAEGGDRLRSFNEQARALGAIITPEQAAAAEEYRDAIGRVQAAWLGLRARLLAEVGPALTDVTNRLASFIAAVPEMIANLMASVRAAFSDGPEAKAAREKFRELFVSLGNVAIASVRSMFRILFIHLLATGDVLMEVLFANWKPRLAKKLVGLVTGAWGLAADAIANMVTGLDAALAKGPWTPQMEATAAWARQMQKLVGTSADAAAAQRLFNQTIDQFLPPTTAINQFNAALSDNGTWAAQIAQAWSDSGIEMKIAAQDVYGAFDALLGITEALARTAIPELKDRLKDLVGGETPWWEEFSRGWRQAWAEWVSEAGNALAQGAELARGLADTISGNLATAINGVIQGTKSMKEAFREFASDTLRQISEIIVRLLIMRAVAAIAGAAGGTGGGSSVPRGTHSGFPAAVNTFVADGGVFNRGHLMKFAAGGVLAAGVVGGIVSRPTVFPMARGMGLMGEAGPEAVMPLRRTSAGRLGVEVAGGGGGTTIVLNQTNYFSGGVNDRNAALTNSRADELLQAAFIRLGRQKPAFREEVRRTFFT